MSKKDKISLKDFVLTYPTTNTVVPVVSPKESFEDKMQVLRAWAMKTMKESLMILVTYSIWAWLLLYSFDRAGYSGLAISITIALLYRLSRIESAVKGKRL